MQEGVHEGTKGRKAGTHHTNIPFDSGPDHDRDVVPSRVIGSDGGVGVDANDAYG